MGQRHLETVAETAFHAAAIVTGVRLAEERGAKDAAYGRDVEVIQDIGTTDVDGQCLRVVGLGVPGEFEGALEIGIEIDGPGHGACVALERSSGTGCGEQSPPCGIRTMSGDGSGANRCASGGVKGTVVKVAVAVVVEA